MRQSSARFFDLVRHHKACAKHGVDDFMVGQGFRLQTIEKIFDVQTELGVTRGFQLAVEK